MEKTKSLLQEIRICMARNIKNRTKPKKSTNNYISEIIDLLNENMEEIDKSIDILNTKFLMDLLVLWGILPNLKFEVSNFQSNKALNQIIAFGQTNMNFENGLGRIETLLHVMETLVLVFSKSNYFKIVINEYYLSFIFCAVFEIENSLKPQTTEESNKKRKKTKEIKIFFLRNVSEYYLIKSIFRFLASNGRNSKSKLSPKMKKKFSTILSRTLLKPHGIEGLLRTLLNENTYNLKKIEIMIEKIVLVKPSFLETRSYLEKICGQIVQLLTVKKEKRIKEIVNLMIIKLAFKYPKFSERLIFDRIFFPLIEFRKLQQLQILKAFEREEKEESITTTSNKESKETTIIPESSVVQCIETIHRLFVESMSGKSILSLLAKYQEEFFKLYSFITRTKLYLKKQCEDIIIQYFKLLPTDKILHFLKSFVKFDKKNSQFSLASFVVFAPGDSGSVCIKLTNDEDLYRDRKAESQSILEILKNLKNDKLISHFFLHLISHFEVLKTEIREIFESEKAKFLATKKSTNDNDLKEIGKGNKIFAKLSKENIVMLELINLMISNFSEKIIKDTSTGLSLVRFMLLNNLREEKKENNGKSKPKMKVGDEEIVENSLSILSTILLLKTDLNLNINEEMDLFDKRSTKSMLIDLREIIQRIETTSAEITSLSTTCSLLIDAKFDTLDGNISKVIKNNEGLNKLKSEKTEETTKMQLKTILKDIRDPSIPVQAFGIARLRKLVISKNEYIEKQLLKVLKLFESQLGNEDSFVFLGAIKGLETMGDLYPSKIIPILTENYGNKKLKVDQRLKIGESLLNIAIITGKGLPKYANYYFDCFIACTKEKNETKKKSSAMVRASSLSNIAEFTEILKFGVHPYLNRILMCVEGSVLYDESENVRRAAIFVYQKLIKTLGTEVFSKFIDKDQLKSICSTLEKIKFYDKDGITKENATRTLNLINSLVSERLVPDFLKK